MKAKARTMRRIFSGMAWAVALSLLVAACSPSTSVPLTEAPTKPPTDAPTEAPTEPPVTEPPATEPPAEPERALSGLPADPRRVDFQAEDGKNLVGYYYASKYADAPIMILMHWAGGDLTDWCEIALWLQNRRDENPVNPERCANAGSGLPAGTAARWLDPTWFPPMNANASIAVFAFDFRDYGESEAGLGSPSDWVKDAHAAFKTVAGFEGVNATRIASLGASIGADGAPDGCLLHNQEAGSGCVGAFSLSPGSYLDMNYAQVIADLASIPVWCLAAENDGASAPTCLSASGESYRSQVYAGSDAHGMMLLSPDFDPQPMVLIQEFVELVFGEKVK